MKDLEFNKDKLEQAFRLLKEYSTENRFTTSRRGLR